MDSTIHQPKLWRASIVATLMGNWSVMVCLNRGCGDVWNSLVKVCFINNGDADGTDFAPVGRPDWLLCPVDCLRTYRPGLLILTAFWRYCTYSSTIYLLAVQFIHLARGTRAWVPLEINFMLLFFAKFHFLFSIWLGLVWELILPRFPKEN
jgi:hypothetical protein